MEETGVYKAIAAVQDELARMGISKEKKNIQQGYNFRGIDDVYNVLAPVLAKNKLCFLPRVLTRSCVERQTQKGNALFYVTVEAEFDLVSAEDGSMHTIRTFGEAMDSADKATNKAMSAAYKYAAFQTFCIPVDVEDADATTHEVKAKAAPKQPPPQPRDVPDFSPPPPVSTAAEMAPETEMITDPQRTKIQILMKGKGSRDAKLDYLTAWRRRYRKDPEAPAMGSSNEFTKAEASAFIEDHEK